MAKVRIVHGQFVDMLTPDEFYRALPRPEQKTRVRVPGSLAVNAAGVVAGDIYKVPTGMEFEVRRVFVTYTGTTPADPNSGNTILTTAGKFLAYTRNGNLIEYAQLQQGLNIQIPGGQTWGSEQGPYLRNGEIFGVAGGGLTPNTTLNVYLEGILTRPASNADA